jgi:2-hydroxy-6-oxonona-2,4-dienedioate hydrolase
VRWSRAEYRPLLPIITATHSVITEQTTSRFVRISKGNLDTQIDYNDAGNGDATIVLLHGSGLGASGWSNFNRNVGPLVEAGCQVA